MLGPVKHDHVRVALTAMLFDRWGIGVDHHSINLRTPQQRVEHVMKQRPPVPEGPMVLARHSLGFVTHRHQGDQPVPAARPVGRVVRQRLFTRLASEPEVPFRTPSSAAGRRSCSSRAATRRGFQGGVVDRVRGIPARMMGAPGLGRVVEPLPELCGDCRRAVEAAIGAGQLVVAEPQDRPELLSQRAVAQGGAHVGDDVPGKERGEIAAGEVRMRVDRAHRHRLAPVAVPHLLPGLVVHVDDLRFSHVRDPTAALLALPSPRPGPRAPAGSRRMASTPRSIDVSRSWRCYRSGFACGQAD